MGSGARKPAGGPLRGVRWIWVAGGIFAVVAVLSASGRFPGTGAESSSAVGNGGLFNRDQVVGTRGHDTLAGTENAEQLFTFGGDDDISAGDGSDLIDAGNGQDVVDAGDGGDRVRAFDGDRDVIRCGEGEDVAYVDAVDVTFDCEELMEAQDMSAPVTPDPPDKGDAVDEGTGAPAPTVRGTVVLEDESWSCSGPVDVDLVKVRIGRGAHGVDAVSLGEGCTGRIGRVEIDTSSGDGIKVQNSGDVAHDLVIESGYVTCHGTTPGYHQDGIQVMGGRDLVFRNLTVRCGGQGVNAALFIAKGGAGESSPTDVVFENGTLGPGAAQTILLADSARSGARNTIVCPGRYTAVRTRSAEDPILSGIKERGSASPACQTQ